MPESDRTISTGALCDALLFAFAWITVVIAANCFIIQTIMTVKSTQ